MPVDTTYSFFSAPDFEITPPVILPNHNKNNAVVMTKRSSRMSHPELTAMPGSNELRTPTTKSTAIEEWTNDYTYGFFDSPTLNVEPIHKEVKSISRRESPTILDNTKRATEYDGYSFYGI